LSPQPDRDRCSIGFTSVFTTLSFHAFTFFFDASGAHAAATAGRSRAM